MCDLNFSHEKRLKNDLVSKTLAMQAQGTGFDPSTPVKKISITYVKKLGIVTCPCNPNDGVQSQEDLWDLLNSQSSLIYKLQRETFSPKIRWRAVEEDT